MISDGHKSLKFLIYLTCYALNICKGGMGQKNSLKSTFTDMPFRYPYPWVIGRLLLYQLFRMCKVYLEYLIHIFWGATDFDHIIFIKPDFFKSPEA